MSKDIGFDDLVVWATELSAAYRLAIEHIGQHLGAHPDVAAVYADRDAHDFIGIWSFSSLPLEALESMLGVMDRLLEELPALLADEPDRIRRLWCERELVKLREAVAARIGRVRRHGTLAPPGWGVVVRYGLYWDAPEQVVRLLQQFLMRREETWQRFKHLFEDIGEDVRPPYLGDEREVALFNLRAEVAEMELLLPAMLSTRRPEVLSAVAGHLGEFRRALETRLEEIL